MAMAASDLRRPESCAPYVCGGPVCKTDCTTDADCTEQLCDLRGQVHECAAVVVAVDCATKPTALQAAINGCTSACYFRVSGTCDKFTVQARDVYVAGAAGAAIRPTSLDVSAVTVLEAGTSETTRLALTNLAIKGAKGTPGIGIEAGGSGGGNPEVFCARCTIGGPGAESNDGAGISATNATVTVTGGTVQNNSGAGISATNATVTVTGGTVQNNSGAGISATQTGFTVENSILARNGLVSGRPGMAVLSDTAGLPKVFRHNTVAGNGHGGMSCSGSEAITTIYASLFWNPGAWPEVDGCVADATSDIPNRQDACGNGEATEPGFVELQPPDSNFHLLPTSLCIDKIACLPEVTTDIDGESRPNGPSLCDVGADEVYP
ncbi:MAG: right-handed parallel beta-helix repeat-containing protein [Myxococcales bacterium]